MIVITIIIVILTMIIVNITNAIRTAIVITISQISLVSIFATSYISLKMCKYLCVHFDQLYIMMQNRTGCLAG